jgi:hypothetical protein
MAAARWLPCTSACHAHSALNVGCNGTVSHNAFWSPCTTRRSSYAFDSNQVYVPIICGRDELAVKVAALEERLDEMRAEHGQAATYKQVLIRD